MDNLKFEQNRLRHDLIEEVKDTLVTPRTFTLTLFQSTKLLLIWIFALEMTMSLINPETTITREEFEKLK